MAKWKDHSGYTKTGPNISPQEEVADMDRVPSVSTMKEAGGKATDLKPLGQNTPQPGTGLLTGRNFLGHRVT